MYYFNSRNEYHKKPFGAVKQNTTVQFTVISDDSDYSPFLCIKNDHDVKEIHIPMDYSLNEEGYSKFTACYTFENTGLFLYCFKFYNGKSGLYNTGHGNGKFYEQGQWFLQTVYDKEFSTPDKFKGGVVYQIFPDRFFEGKAKNELYFSDRIYRKNKAELPFFENDSTNNKQITTDYFGGDLQGIIQKLDYIKNMGVNCIYLNPIFEAHSNHRYNTANYKKIDPDLGTLDDFKSLCTNAHQKGISIILDGVFSHTGSDSIYFNKNKRYSENGAFNDENSPYRKWYDFDIKYKNGYRCWWDFATLPEVNENEKSYIDYICGDDGVIQYWLNNGADGFRLDVADELPDEFIEEIRKAVKKCGEHKLLIGEVWEDAVTKISFGKRRDYLLGKGLDSTMNYPFRSAVLNFIKNGDGDKLCEDIFKIYENYPKPALDVAWNIISTHDTPRAITYFQGNSPESTDRFWQSKQKLSKEKLEKAKLQLICAFAFMFTLPGTPCIYYGDEIAMDGYSDPFNRKYFDWNYTDKTILNNIKKLSVFRKNHAQYKDGNLYFVYASFNTVAFVRYANNKEVLTAVNRGDFQESFYHNGKHFTVNPLDYLIEEI